MEADLKISPIEAQLRECFGRVAWAHKTQEKRADSLGKWNSIFKWTQIVLSALNTAGILYVIFGGVNWVLWASAILSLLLVCINSYLKEYNLEKLIQEHSNSANEIRDIRDSYVSLLTDINKEGFLSYEEVVKKRDTLQRELKEIYKVAPRTTSRAYKKASKALQKDEELTFSDEEIDNLLPKELRKNK
ncbi:MAG: SLATT domain-containing protein [Bacteroidales bacterium]